MFRYCFYFHTVWMFNVCMCMQITCPCTCCKHSIHCDESHHQYKALVDDEWPYKRKRQSSICVPSFPHSIAVLFYGTDYVCFFIFIWVLSLSLSHSLRLVPGMLYFSISFRLRVAVNGCKVVALLGSCISVDAWHIEELLSGAFHGVQRCWITWSTASAITCKTKRTY